MITPPCTEGGFVPNKRIQSLLQMYEQYSSSCDESVLKSELYLRTQINLLQSWQYPSGGAETRINDPNLEKVFNLLKNVIVSDKINVEVHANRSPAIQLILASQSSELEKVLVYLDHILCGGEAKGVDDSEYVALMQCIQVCADAALNLYRHGCDSQDCVVPGVICYGETIRLISVYFIPPTFPVVTYLTPPLQLCNVRDRRTLARWISVLGQFCTQTIQLLTSKNDIRKEEQVSYQLLSNLFYKPVRNIEKIYGALVGVPLSDYDISSARVNLDAIMHVYSLLHAVPDADKYILFPLGILACPQASIPDPTSSSREMSASAQSTSSATEAETADVAPAMISTHAPTLRDKLLHSMRKYFPHWNDVQSFDHLPFIVFQTLQKSDGWDDTRPPVYLVDAYLQALQRAICVLNTARVAHMDLR